ncbi:YjgN family protein [Bowmanella pacifica]|uniref:Membrane protein n=1 Tax=Bowmanella pacifica TaxID=502051 RepID=A0A918DH23_9ALTE|nr:YjgN family protein [Bowmanella pacifica]GGO64039.1 membrane protein [Bowmanella pacifica]
MEPVDYSTYSLSELNEARKQLDDTVHPEHAEVLDAWIAYRQAPAQPAPSSTEPEQPRRAAVRFHGDGQEFFGIWIVNLLLSIVTLGIYSAWAKVRTNRYFYGNLEADGHRFSYLAEPMQILKGRIIGLVLFGSYMLASYLSPFVAAIIMLLLFALMPVMICLSLRFNARMTAYRNVRFGFQGGFGRAYALFMLYPILSIFTLYLTMPIVLKKMDEYIYGNMRFGDRQFQTNLRTGEYYVAAIGASIIGAIMAVIIMVPAGILIAVLAGSGSLQEPEGPAATVFLILTMLMYVLVITVASCYYQSHIRNHLYNNSHIEKVVKLESALGFWALTKLRLVNLLMLVGSLGLAYPWVKVRTAALFAEATHLQLFAEADQVVAENSADPNAIAEEVSEIFDMDIGLT